MRKPRGSGWLALLCLVAHCRDAAAFCLGEEPSVLWSSPADGEAGVAPDADLVLVVGGFDGAIEVSLGAEPLSSGEIPDVYDLGTLEPDLEYTVTVEWLEAAVTKEIHFTTGSAVAREPAPGVRVNALVEAQCATSLCDLSAACEVVARKDQCFDIGMPMSLTADVEGEAVAWALEITYANDPLVRIDVVPASCGPTWLRTGRDTEASSMRLIAIRDDGATAESCVIEAPGSFPSGACAPEPIRVGDADTSGGESGCSSAVRPAPQGSGVSVVGLLVLAAGAARRRRFG